MVHLDEEYLESMLRLLLQTDKQIIIKPGYDKLDNL